jgi:hypothetical protein
MEEGRLNREENARGKMEEGCFHRHSFWEKKEDRGKREENARGKKEDGRRKKRRDAPPSSI